MRMRHGSSGAVAAALFHRSAEHVPQVGQPARSDTGWAVG
jgi:hypothetical protein